MTGLLSIVGTPIGNLDDLSPRAARALAAADIIACEDTRVARTLITRARLVTGEPIRARLIATHARNEEARTPELVHAIASGSRVALTTDAGMPGLSDPGHRLVAACAEAGLKMEVIPGPSAVPAALVASGLPTARFVFEGFLPRQAGARRRRLVELVTEERTLVLFEAPHRLADTLEAMADVFGVRRAAIARELTKLHEEIARGTLSELADRVRVAGVRGEVTLVVAGAEAPVRLDYSGPDLAAAVQRRIEAGEDKRAAIAAVAVATHTPKREVYQAVLEAKT